MNGSLFSIARYMDGVCFKVSGGTSVPKLPPSYPPPPEPEIAQYSPYFLPLIVFTASKGLNRYIFLLH